jgi:uncharacterized protein YaiL (DUF2058 family)
MSNSLKDQLLGLGFKAPAPEPRKPEPARPAARPQDRRKDGGRDGARPRDAARPPRDGAPTRAGRDAARNGPPSKPGEARRPGPRAAPGAARPQDARRGPGGPRPGGGKSRAEMDLGKAFALRAQQEKEERIAAEAARQEEARLRREARAKLSEFLKDRVLNDAAADIARHFPYGGKIKRIHVTADQLAALNRGELGVLQQDGRYLLVDKETLDAAEAIFAPAVALRVDPDAPAGDDPYADPQYQVPDDLVW